MVAGKVRVAMGSQKLLSLVAVVAQTPLSQKEQPPPPFMVASVVKSSSHESSFSSLAVGSNGGVTIKRASFICCFSICDRDFSEEDESDASSCSSSSVGRNSASLEEDFSDWEGSSKTEVQSSFKGPLDTMNDLQEDLPVK